MNTIDNACDLYRKGQISGSEVMSLLNRTAGKPMPLTALFRKGAKEANLGGYIFFYDNRLYFMVSHEVNGKPDMMHIEKASPDAVENTTFEVLMSSNTNTASLLQPLCDQNLLFFSCDLYTTYKQILAILRMQGIM